MEEVVRTALASAVRLAQTGDCQRARELCATVVFANQPLFAARKDLLCMTLHALFVARGFKLLSRFIMAMSGADAEILLLSDCEREAVLPRCDEQPGQTIYTVGPLWLAQLSPDDTFLQRWSDALAEGYLVRPDGKVVGESERQLQPA